MLIDSKKKIVLHICCAPDATVAVERLSSDYEIATYFYNPNIHPEPEYHLRREEMRKLADEIGVPFYCGSYDVDQWYGLTRGLEQAPEGGARCQVCFRMRLEKTAQFAREQGFDLFTTVLTVSPHKNAALINKLGQEIASQYGVEFLTADFKKKDGFKRSLELSRKYHLYRQDYCGCIYSKLEREARKRK